ncbi:hypothetical protein ACHBTE_12860 [Streptomyces sp. M41]|uniref:hypothetical protein n=1 Tax=Streptomyces sp. M41 TaxID=3059412 RepID=UPI00374C97C4
MVAATAPSGPVRDEIVASTDYSSARCGGLKRPVVDLRADRSQSFPPAPDTIGAGFFGSREQRDVLDKFEPRSHGYRIDPVLVPG